MVQVLPELQSQSFFLTYGFPNITMCDINGITWKRHRPNLNWMQEKMVEVTNLGE